jgi:DNA-binding beta-propeller fold protein YncE
MVQKYTHDGSKLLLQIGTRGVYDTSDETVTGRALNSSHTAFFKTAGVAVDPVNQDVYFGDGYGNSRVVVFDRNGHYLRQWGRQGTKAEAEAGVAGAFMQVVHCVTIGNDGLVYVCDRQGDRVQVFDKMGKFQRNIWIRNGTPHMPDAPAGTVQQVAFSPDQAQKFMYVGNEHNEEIDILDHASGQIIGSFGRVGHQVGEFGHIHSIAMDSKGNLYTGEVNWGKRIQKFKLVANQ